ncbi:hypothetical protein [Streptomyces sp. NPDC001985]|uniref:hypothetical protein n=1 Tax=Streptomyces sp. NPDC001985 TaxID=3154406 RepID=UPI00332166DC
MREPVDHAEDELRVLLERATPELSAPEGRLRQVRERVARRRRRRAGAAVLTVTALAVAGTLLPQTLDGLHHRPDSTASPAGTPSVRAVEALPAPGSVRGAGPLRFSELEGLAVDLPSSWHALAAPADSRNSVEAVGYLSTQPLTSLVRPCGRDRAPNCAPVERLAPGEVLIEVDDQTSVNPGREKTSRALGEPAGMDRFCERIGGSAMYTAEVLNEDRYHDLRSVFRVCVTDGTSERTVRQAQKIVDSARYRDRSAPAAPLTEIFDRPPTTGATQ